MKKSGQSILKKSLAIITKHRIASTLFGVAAISGLIFLWFNTSKSPLITGPLDKPSQVTSTEHHQTESTKEAPTTPDDIAYFKEIALGAEWHERDQRIHKWNRNNLTVSMHLPAGTDDDKRCLEDAIADFNKLSTTLKLNLGELNGMLGIRYTPKAQFRDYEASTPADAYSYATNHYDEANRHISYAFTLVDTGLTTEKRCKHTRSMLLRGLGFLQSSDKYPESLFYNQGSDKWSTSDYSNIDKKLIRYMYGDYGITSLDNATTIDQKLLN